MLINVLSSLYHQIETLASVWLAEGASSFSLWENDHQLARWSDNDISTKKGVSAPIHVNGVILGEIWLAGLNSSRAKVRLKAEAELLSQLFQLEDELDKVTEELIDTQDQLVALYDVTRSTRHHLDLNDALWFLIKEVKRLAKAKGAFIMINVNSKTTIIEQLPSSLVTPAILEYLQKKSLIFRDEVLIHNGDFSLDLPKGTSSLFIVPIRINKQADAILGVFFNHQVSSLSPHLKLTRALAEYVGSQIESFFLHEIIVAQARLRTELELAAQIQLRLLPNNPPFVPGLDLAAGSRPALQVGGDFYDFIFRPHFPFTFVLGDVAGKGMSAALLMATSRTVLRSKAKFIPAPKPDIILEFSNEEMYDDFTEVGMFATIFVGQYEPHQNRLIYANAGHSPVIYCPINGPAQLLEADGPANGVLPKSMSKCQELQFKTGDLLIVTTDGFNEVHNQNGEMFGYARLISLVELVADKSAAEISNILFESVNNFGGDLPQNDDQTLIVVKRVENKYLV